MTAPVDRHCYRQNVAGADFTGPIAMQIGARDFVMPGANVVPA